MIGTMEIMRSHRPEVRKGRGYYYVTCYGCDGGRRTERHFRHPDLASANQYREAHILATHGTGDELCEEFNCLADRLLKRRGSSA